MKKWFKKAVFALVEWAGKARRKGGLEGLCWARSSRGLAGLDNLENPEIPEPLARLGGLGLARKAGAFWLMGVVVMMGLAGCSGEDFRDDTTGESAIEEAAQEAQTIYRLCITARKGNGSETRALSLDGKTLNATWQQGESVTVYGVTGEGASAMETADPVATLFAQTDGEWTTLTGYFNISYTPQVGRKLVLKYQSPSYQEQEGTLDFIARKCDYATAEVTITNVTFNPDLLASHVNLADAETSPAEFVNQQAIVRFLLAEKGTGNPILTDFLIVKFGTSTYRISLPTPASEIFVAIPQKTSKNVALWAGDDAAWYVYEKSGVTFLNGQFYSISVKMDAGAKCLPLSALSKAEIGWIIASDGLAYPPAGAMPNGVTPVAMIGHISAMGHGLAMEINSAYPQRIHTLAATTATAQKPSVIGGTWRLPSLDDWLAILDGCAIEGDLSDSFSSGNRIIETPILGFYNKCFAAGFNEAVFDNRFWTSTESDDGTFMMVHPRFSASTSSVVCEPQEPRSSFYVMAFLKF